MPSDTAITEENRLHERNISDLKEDYDHRLQGILTDANKENIAAEVFVGVAIVLDVFIGALLVPEPVFSKLAAVLIGAGLGIFLVALLVYVLLKSRDDIETAWKDYKKAKDAENDRHEKVLRTP